MAWLVAIVVLVLLVVSAGFRAFTFIIVLFCAGAGGLYYFYDQHRQARALTLISPSEITFENVLLNQQYGSYTISGRVTNHSTRYTLSLVELRITMQDCTEDSSHSCITIGQVDESAYVNAPPGQARDFEVRPYFSELKPQGRLEWSYAVSQIRSEK
jgi:hypothetical protein